MSTILVTGSSGKTSSQLAALLRQNGHKFLIASRSGSAPEPYTSHGVKFDWNDSNTFRNPFDAASDIGAVYLVAPSDGDPVKQVTAFINYAKEHGVKRFVLLSASVVPASGPFMGQVHQTLIELEHADGIEWAVLRPTWFAENFTTGTQAEAVRDKDTIFTATGDGKLPFVSARDIAAVAYRALVDNKPHNADHIILGPESLSYDEAASRLSKVIGRPITHRHNTLEDQVEFFASSGGLPREYAQTLANLDLVIKSGAEDKTNDIVFKLTGQQPRTIEDVFEEHKAVWQSPK